MDVTFTNVLQGARQYFQGIPSSSNATVRISNLPDAHGRIPASNAQDVSVPDRFWPVHLQTPSRRHTTNHSPVRQSVAHVQNSTNQRLQYNKERLEEGFPQYKIPYNEKDDGPQEQHHQFRQARILQIKPNEQEHPPQSHLYPQHHHQSNQHHPPSNQHHQQTNQHHQQTSQQQHQHASQQLQQLGHQHQPSGQQHQQASQQHQQSGQQRQQAGQQYQQPGQQHQQTSQHLQQTSQHNQQVIQQQHQQSNQLHHQPNQQQKRYYHQQPKHHSQKSNYHYVQQHGMQHEVQYHNLHQMEQSQTNSSAPYQQQTSTSYRQAQEQSHYMPKQSSSSAAASSSSVVHQTQNVPTYGHVPSEKLPMPSYHVDYSWQRTYAPKKASNRSESSATLVNPPSFTSQNHVYPKNVPKEQNYPCDSSYINANQKGTAQTEIYSKTSEVLLQRYEQQGHNLSSIQASSMANRTATTTTTRETIITNAGPSRMTASQAGLQTSNPQTNSVQKGLPFQHNLPQGNYELSHLLYQQQRSGESAPDAYGRFPNSDVYKTDNSGVRQQMNRAPEISNATNSNSPRGHTANHEQMNYYMHHPYGANTNPTRKESPLDLSLRTVKTCADSTLKEADNNNDGSLKSPRHKPTALSSIKQYPQFDVEFFEKNITQRSSQMCNTADTRYEFKPNFNVLNHSHRAKHFPSGSSNQGAPPKQGDASSKSAFTKRNAAAAVGVVSHPNPTNSLVQAQGVSPKFKANATSAANVKKKRAADVPDCEAFNKVPKIVDPWRKSIDMQIEERFSSYQQQQNNKYADNSDTSSIYNSYASNEGFKEASEYPQQQQQQSGERVASSQACVIQDTRQYCTAVDNQNYGAGFQTNLLPGNVKVQNNRLFGADKRVLNILRSSLETKSKKKLEQQKTQEKSNIQRCLVDEARTTTVQHENVIKRNAFATDVLTTSSEILQASTNSSVCHDNFAEFLAARIRTKGELKQGGSSSSLGSNNLSQEQNVDGAQKHVKSELSNSEASIATIRQNATPRKRVFSKTEDGNNLTPIRNKSDLRSSSETSVFDFPDSDLEDEDKESLEAMRKCRKSKQDVIVADVKLELSVESPGDNEFTKLCDDFVQQLKTGCKKKTKRKKIPDSKMSEEEELVLLPETNSVDVSTNDIPGEEVVENAIDTPIVSKGEVADAKEANNNQTNVELMNECVSENNKENREANSVDEVESKIVEIPNEIDCKLDVTLKIKSEKDDNCSKESETTVPNARFDDGTNVKTESSKSPANSKCAISIIRPSKKPSFGDPSYFYPGWEEGVYKYKKSLRIPPTLIQISRPPQFHRLSTSLPDLDPYAQSPTVYSPNDNDGGLKLMQTKSESLESDNESDYNYNVFGKKTNYDSESSVSVTSSPNSTKESSILDRLLEKYGRSKERKRRNELRQRKLEDAKLGSSTTSEGKDKKCCSPAIKSEPELLDYEKTTINNLKEAFMKTPTRDEDVTERLTAVILKARTRKEFRILKQRATIKEVFGEERPASAPPITSLNDFKKGVFDEDNCLGRLVIKLEKRDDMIDKIMQKQKQMQAADNDVSDRGENVEKEVPPIEIKIEPNETELLENLDESNFIKFSTERFDTHSVDEFENNVRGRRKRHGKMRRKLSSGFDYIRKKKKVKKELIKNLNSIKKEKVIAVEKTPESIHDIHKEIKTWVLNKGIGETHLHRAARLGYTDVTAFCLENLNCNPSPKDNAGYTPLHEACARGHLDIAKVLLMYGANPSESAQGGVRPLHEACENGYVEITRLLLSYGADPTLVTYSGLTPLALTNEETTKNFLMNHLNDIEGESSAPWILPGPASCFEHGITTGYNMLENVPEGDVELVEEDIQFEVADKLLPNFYTLQNEPATDRWILLQDLSNLLKIKSKDALLRQITHPSTTNFKSVFKEMKLTDFLEQAQCCQFLNSGEKINSRASKIALVKYTNKLKELLNIESITITR